MDILYSKLCQKKEFTIMYEMARRKMKCRQDTYATYYDQKSVDCPLQEGDSVYVYLPRNRRKELTKKWKRPYKIVEANHPVYHVEIQTENGLQRYV